MISHFKIGARDFDGCWGAHQNCISMKDIKMIIESGGKPTFQTYEIGLAQPELIRQHPHRSGRAACPR